MQSPNPQEETTSLNYFQQKNTPQTFESSREAHDLPSRSCGSTQ